MKEFKIGNRQSLYEYMHVAKRLGNLNVRDRAHSNWETARELARPSTSDVIIEQVLEGTINANPDAIKQARKEEAEAKRRAVEAVVQEVLSGFCTPCIFSTRNP